MNKENAHQFLPLVQALVDGKTLQFNYGNAWIDAASNADFNWLGSPDHYRIKPEPRTFEMWYYKPTGRIYPWVEEEKRYFESDKWERITVQEVLG